MTSCHCIACERQWLMTGCVSRRWRCVVQPQAVMPWVEERVFPLLAPHQSVWLIPGSFGAPPSYVPAAGNLSHQVSPTQLRERALSVASCDRADLLRSGA